MAVHFLINPFQFGTALAPPSIRDFLSTNFR